MTIGDRDPGSLEGWHAVRTFPMDVLELVVGSIDAVRFAQKAVAHVSVNVRPS